MSNHSTEKTEAPKEYRLVTIADIIDVLTPENIDNFLIDFKSFVETAQNLFKLAALIDPELQGKKNSDIGQAVFNWIDDGKHEATGGLRITHPETNQEIDLPLDIEKMNKIVDQLTKK